MIYKITKADLIIFLKQEIKDFNLWLNQSQNTKDLLGEVYRMDYDYYYIKVTDHIAIFTKLPYPSVDAIMDWPGYNAVKILNEL